MWRGYLTPTPPPPCSHHYSQKNRDNVNSLLQLRVKLNTLNVIINNTKVA